MFDTDHQFLLFSMLIQYCSSWRTGCHKTLRTSCCASTPCFKDGFKWYVSLVLLLLTFRVECGKKMSMLIPASLSLCFTHLTSVFSMAS